MILSLANSSTARCLLSRALPATCQGKVVKVNGITVDATILSQGTKSSTGTLLLEGAQATYVASNASDIKDILTQLDQVLTKITTALTGIDAVTVSPGSNAAAIALITVAQTTLTALKDNLK